MSFIPNDEIKGQSSMNMAPMIDFLFLMLMFFACLAISRVTTKDTEIDLVNAAPETKVVLTDASSDIKVVNISITEDGQYKWITEIRDYIMNTPEAIANELNVQYDKGILPSDRLNTQVLLKIDKNATWDPILKAIFAIRDAGFEVHPVYLPEEIDSISR
jgi:biopolymer transport protein ExbD